MFEAPRVVVTRSANQAASFSQLLQQAGFTPVEFPAIQLVPLPWEPLDTALAGIATFDWLVFTSGNAVDFFLQRADELNFPLENLPSVAVVGSATAARLKTRGIPIAFMPKLFAGRELVLGMEDLANKKVLLPRSKIGRPEIVELLQMRGAEVVEVPLYDTVTAVPTPDAFAALNKKFAAVTFTSPSSVRNFFQIMADYPEELNEPVEDKLREAVVVCIGPETAAAAAEAKLQTVLIPNEYSIKGMVRLLSTALSIDSIS